MAAGRLILLNELRFLGRRFFDIFKDFVGGVIYLRLRNLEESLTTVAKFRQVVHQ